MGGLTWSEFLRTLGQGFGVQLKTDEGVNYLERTVGKDVVYAVLEVSESDGHKVVPPTVRKAILRRLAIDEGKFDAA